MPKIIVLGGGVCGLATSMLLARDGHEVTVLERDPEPVPDSPEDAWESWARRGVVQFRQAHYLHARATQVIQSELPEIGDGLIDAGAALVDPVKRMPPRISDRSPRPGDERLATFTARRPTIEHVFGRVAGAQPGLTVRRGVSVERLTMRPGPVPHVTGVRTDEGEELSADLVVDAMGRGSRLPAWLRDAGCAPVTEEAEDSGFIYYTRFFRAAGNGVPELRGPLLTPVGSISVLTLPSDQETWSVTLFAATHDQPLKRLRHADAWTAVLAACPQAHWLDGEPITEVLPMAGVIDRWRRFAPDGTPVVTGLAPVADAWACTNPSLGRGIALGLVHAAYLRDTVRSHLDDPGEFAKAWDEVTERELTPWYRATVAVDRARFAEMDALKNGLEPPGPKDFAAGLGAALPLAMAFDPDVFRAGLEIVSCLALPEEVFSRPGLAERVMEIAAEHPAEAPPGPSREELLRILAEPAGVA